MIEDLGTKFFTWHACADQGKEDRAHLGTAGSIARMALVNTQKKSRRRLEWCLSQESMSRR